MATKQELITGVETVCRSGGHHGTDCPVLLAFSADCYDSGTQAAGQWAS